MTSQLLCPCSSTVHSCWQASRDFFQTTMSLTSGWINSIKQKVDSSTGWCSKTQKKRWTPWWVLQSVQKAVWFHTGCVYMSALIAFDWSWHLECECTIGWVIREGGPSGSNQLEVVGGVEADLAAAQLSFTPALFVLLSQLQQLLTWKESQLTVRLKGIACTYTHSWCRWSKPEEERPPVLVYQSSGPGSS